MSRVPLLYEDGLLLPPAAPSSSFSSTLQALNPFYESQLVEQLNNLFTNPEKPSPDGFEAHVDIQQFKPEEITVKLIEGGKVVIEGKHKEKLDEHGSISRQFVRTYQVPEDCDLRQLHSRLSLDGVLTISAPKKPEQAAVITYVDIPVRREDDVRGDEGGDKKSL